MAFVDIKEKYRCAECVHGDEWSGSCGQNILMPVLVQITNHEHCPDFEEDKGRKERKREAKMRSERAALEETEDD